ncbi:MAG: hypothetical protein AB7Q16_06000 [Vicinamibacterales bacterium]
MALTLVVAPGREPITIEEAKIQARVTHTRDDLFLDEVVIPGVRDRAELATMRQLITATWAETFDDWPCEGYIEVPRPPLQSVSSITYVDPAGVTQTWSPSLYVVDAPAGPRATRGRIAPAHGQSWPSVRMQLNAITVTFIAGYGDEPKDVPPLLRRAMLLDLGTMYEHREDLVAGMVVNELPVRSATVYQSFKCRPTQRRLAS